MTSTSRHAVRNEPLRGLLVAVAVVLAVVTAACAPADDGDAEPGLSPTTSTCSEQARTATVTPGTLTIATSKPAYSPWFEDDDPASGKGFESAVAYAVADRLGYDRDTVTWTIADFNAAIAPGEKQYDLNVQQISITDERRQAVDFSSGYYDVAQAFVTTKTSKAAAAKSIADLAKLKLGAATGTTSYTAITDVIRPAQQPAVFDDNDKAKLALANGQIDALAADLPTALYLAAAELDGGVVVGQLPVTGADPEQFGFVLEKGSRLTPCVTEAVDGLRADGTLERLEQEWLTQAAGAPVLR